MSLGGQTLRSCRLLRKAKLAQRCVCGPASKNEAGLKMPRPSLVNSGVRKLSSSLRLLSSQKNPIRASLMKFLEKTWVSVSEKVRLRSSLTSGVGETRVELGNGLVPGKFAKKKVAAKVFDPVLPRNRL